MDKSTPKARSIGARILVAVTALSLALFSGAAYATPSPSPDAVAPESPAPVETYTPLDPPTPLAPTLPGTEAPESDPEESPEVGESESLEPEVVPSTEAPLNFSPFRQRQDEDPGAAVPDEQYDDGTRRLEYVGRIRPNYYLLWEKTYEVTLRTVEDLPAAGGSVGYFEIIIPRSLENASRIAKGFSEVSVRYTDGNSPVLTKMAVKPGDEDQSMPFVVRFYPEAPIPAAAFAPGRQFTIVFDSTELKSLQNPRDENFLRGSEFRVNYSDSTDSSNISWQTSYDGGGTATVRIKASEMRVGDSLRPLPGAQFQLRAPNNEAVIDDPGFWLPDPKPHDPHWGFPGTPIGEAWAFCTTDSSGTCEFKVPAPRKGGKDAPAAYWVAPVKAPEGYEVIDQMRAGFSGSNRLGSSHRFDYAYRTPALYANDVVVSGSRDFMTFVGGNSYSTYTTGEGVNKPRSSSGQFVFRRVNPPLPPQRCELNVGIILDTSGSMGSILHGSSTATARDVTLRSLHTFFGNLKDTGVSVGFTTFSDSSASRNSGIQRIEPRKVEGRYHDYLQDIVNPKHPIKKVSFGGATNWDDALRVVAEYNQAHSNDGKGYDIVFMLTDGNPTRTSIQSQRGPGNAGDFAMMENAILRANWLRSTTADGTRLVGIGVGEMDRGGFLGQDPDPTVSRANMDALFGTSGRELGQQHSGILTDIGSQDWITFAGDNPAGLAQALTDYALANCDSTVTVEKETGINGESFTKAEGNWNFIGSNLPRTYRFNEASQSGSLTRTATPDGPAEFRIRTGDANARGAITITETQQAGWTLSKQDGFNARCTDANGSPVRVTNAGQLGFRIDNIPFQSKINCVVRNSKDEPRFQVEKAVSGFPAGTTGAPVKVNTDGTAKVTYEVKVTNTGRAAGSHPQIADTLTLPAGFTATRVAVDGRSQNSLSSFTIPGVPLQPGASKTYRVEVNLQATAIDSIDWKLAGQCDTNGAGNPAAGGVFNLVTMVRDADGPDNNDACVPLLPPDNLNVQIQKVDSTTGSPLDGAQFVVFPANPDGTYETRQAIQANEGKFAVRNGRFAIVEQRAPSGYSLLLSPVYFEIENSKIYLLELSGSSLKRVDGGTLPLVALLDSRGAVASSGGVSPNDSTFQIRIENVKMTELPASGGIGVNWFMVSGSVLAIAALAGIVITGRRKLIA